MKWQRWATIAGGIVLASAVLAQMFPATFGTFNLVKYIPKVGK